MDAITLLKEDHRTVEKLFKRFEKAGPKAHVEKREIADRIVEELSRHAAIEEMIFYPVSRATVPDTDDVVLESLEEHHVMKWLLDEIDSMDPTDERFTAKVTVLIENTRHHVEEEESEFFPQVREELGRKALGEIGDAMAEAKKTAPTHPHPRSPDTPPGNVVASAAASATDRVRDTASGVAQGGAELARDVVARVLGSKRQPKAPSGSKVTRTTAAKVKRSVEEARATGEAATKKATRRGKATAKAASSGAKGTATSARKGAKGTAKTATSAAKSTAKTTRSAAKTTAKTTKSAAKTTARSTKSTAKRTAKSAKAGAKNTRSTAKRAATTTKRAASR